MKQLKIYILCIVYNMQMSQAIRLILRWALNW